MIPPSLLDVSYYFSWVPVWEDEPITPNADATSDNASGNAEGSKEANTESTSAGEQPAGDADGVNDVNAVQRVFKGYRLVAEVDYTATAFTGYTRWIENGQDEDLERGRRDERARRAVTPRPASAQAPEQPAAPEASESAPSDGDD